MKSGRNHSAMKSKPSGEGGCATIALATADQYSPLKIIHLTQQTILPKLQRTIWGNELDCACAVFHFAVKVEMNVALKPILVE